MAVEQDKSHNEETDLNHYDALLLRFLSELFTELSNEEIARETWNELRNKLHHGRLSEEEYDLTVLLASFVLAKLSGTLDEVFRFPSESFRVAIRGTEYGRRQTTGAR